ncbi:hypothetical protein H4219_001628 [Mycoemilia scoparia]|uniref:Glycoside hydrolase 35 catalytic domain-containing protein n=1 Tax=Mycoemilia scoparia TaxID=417184 RepID=A0A9W8DVU0_9FUNG|nr:hypothetical protein H4219_001628 [Mycoemilia scoparia]
MGSTIILRSKLFAGIVGLIGVFLTFSFHPLLSIFSIIITAIGFVIWRIRYHFDSGLRLTSLNDVKLTSTGEVAFIEEISGEKFSQAVTTESVAFARKKYVNRLEFDRFGLTVNGKPVVLISTDFDYWNIINGHLGTWRQALLRIKACGVNTVRLRFHWGFHSASPNQYNFDEDHDVKKLLEICSEVGMYVIAAVGPYIGEDVQAGGYPQWLIPNKSYRLRHMWHSGWKRISPEFAIMNYDWYSQILPIIQPFQVTNSLKTDHQKCVVLVQVENQLYSRMGKDGFPMHLRDEMRALAYGARDFSITVPLVANNLKTSELVAGNLARAYKYVEDKLRKWKLISDDFFVDIEGHTLFPGTLNTDTVLQDLYPLRANNTPLLINEIDQMSATPYNLSFELASVMAAGSTIFSMSQLVPTSFHDIFSSVYVHELSPKSSFLDDGLMYSEQGLKTHLLLYSIRSVAHILAKTDSVHERPWIYKPKIRAARGIVVQGQGIRADYRRSALDSSEDVKGLTVEQEAIHGEGLTLVGFVRPESSTLSSPDHSETKKFNLSVILDDDPINAEPVVTLEGSLPADSALVLLSNYDITANTGAAFTRLLASTKPVYLRQKVVFEGYRPSEVWIVPAESVQHGQMAFVGRVNVLGDDASVEYLTDDDGDQDDVMFSIVEFGEKSNLVQINSETQCIYVILVNEEESNTLLAEFSQDGNGAQLISWGSQNVIFDGDEILAMQDSDDGKDQSIIVLGQHKSNGILVKNDTKDQKYPALAFLTQYTIPKAQKSLDKKIEKIESRITDWDTYNWELLPTYTDLESMDDINTLPSSRDLGQFAFLAQDLTFSCCHTVYRGTVHLNYRHLTDKKIRLELNGRHRCTLFVNGKNMSGHTTLSDKLGQAGSYRGPDFRNDTRSYDVTPFMYVGQGNESIRNEVIVLVESFGLGSQARLMNDARTPRGLINAYWHGFNLATGHHHDDSEIHDESNDPRTNELKAPWEMVGVSTTSLSNPYSTSGLPDECETKGWKVVEDADSGKDLLTKFVNLSQSKGPDNRLVNKIRLNVNPDFGVQWIRMDVNSSIQVDLDHPLLFSIKGNVTLYVWVDGHLIGRHHGFRLIKASSSAKDDDKKDLKTKPNSDNKDSDGDERCSLLKTSSRSGKDIKTTFAWYSSTDTKCSVKFMVYGWASETTTGGPANSSGGDIPKGSSGTIPVEIEIK